jgi:hypothetical protein
MIIKLPQSKDEASKYHTVVLSFLDKSLSQMLINAIALP